IHHFSSGSQGKKSAWQRESGACLGRVGGGVFHMKHFCPISPPVTPRAPPSAPLSGLPPVVAVASGKGGVGKSTVAVNLAADLARRGLAVGLLDADIYGPSVPLMLGLSGQRPGTHNGRMVPLVAHGVRALSIGFLLPEAGPVAWRGAMVVKALTQMLAGADWGRLDVLIVDTPPGTGDAHLTLIQRARPAGAVLVTTPQEAALADARRAAGLCARTGVAVWGVVETMAGAVFGQGGATGLGCPVLASVPLDARVRAAGDAGVPLVLAEPDCPPARALSAAAAAVAARL
ncbi:MAG TPA: hypothetical protein DDX54_02950, partial [Rhodospirillaceae bacterium]|nr:hypothetical protein [Rhodospirillaceae bacterium]